MTGSSRSGGIFSRVGGLASAPSRRSPPTPPRSRQGAAARRRDRSVRRGGGVGASRRDGSLASPGTRRLLGARPGAGARAGWALEVGSAWAPVRAIGRALLVRALSRVGASTSILAAVAAAEAGREIAIGGGATSGLPGRARRTMATPPTKAAAAAAQTNRRPR